MAEDLSSLIGHIIDVRGSVFLADLQEEEEGITPSITIGDEDIVVGRLGSYVRVEQGNLSIIAMVARMTEREKLPPAHLGEGATEELQEPTAIRTIQLVPVGSLNNQGEFERGISVYPTTGADVHAIGRAQLAQMFRRFQDRGYDIGTLSSSSELRVHLDPSPLFGRHCAVLGQTGAGKSWTIASLLQKAVGLMPRAHIVLLDLHGEYRAAFTGQQARFINAVELEMPYWLMTYAELCDLLIDRTESTAHNQIAVFRDALNRLRTEEGNALGLERTTLDTPVFFDLGKVRAAIEEQNGMVISPSTGKPIKGPLTGAFDNFLMRLDSRLNDVRYDFLLKPRLRNTSGTLEGLLRDFVGLGTPRSPITVIDISPVPFDVRPTVTAQIGRLAFEFNYWNPRYAEFPILVVCEEAHAYIRRETDVQFEGARQSMERIAKEGRKYGVGIMVVSQRPHELSETVLSQCGTFICLRITNPEDQEYVRKLVPEAERDLVNMLAGLRRGEAI
ncbi:MAG: DUF853 family protein, partial [Deltaproteobacteria bacterium]|nr:DUF853 family protein [Deltaproteobacteria bacterium]